MDLFLHELGDIYDAEQRIVQILPQLAGESANPQTQYVYRQHLQETQQQIQNLEQCFQLLGVKAQRQTCAAVAGLKQEHDAFTQEQPTPDILTLFDLGAAAKTEHYEIASYQGLIEQCSLLGQQDCAQLLQQNLQQEQAMLRNVTSLAQQLGQQMASQSGLGLRGGTDTLSQTSAGGI
jgi:ferritin-like metal-binding protein YciE